MTGCESRDRHDPMLEGQYRASAEADDLRTWTRPEAGGTTTGATTYRFDVYKFFVEYSPTSLLTTS